MPVVEVPGARINYILEGSGEPLLMIRGYGSHLGWWEPSFRDALKERFSLILYDHRGTGKSVHIEGDYTIPLLADDAAALLAELGIEKTIVFGLSMGGMVAQEIALRHPGLPSVMVLGATHCGGDKVVVPAPEVIDLLLSRADISETGEVSGDWLEAVFTPAFVRENPDAVASYVKRAMVLPTPPEIVRMQAQAVIAFSSWDRLPSISIPTWILHGELDSIVPPANAGVLEERIPFARTVFVTDQGHDFTVQDPLYSARLLAGMLGHIS